LEWRLSKSFFKGGEVKRKSKNFKKRKGGGGDGSLKVCIGKNNHVNADGQILEKSPILFPKERERGRMLKKGKKAASSTKQLYLPHQRIKRHQEDQCSTYGF